MRKLFVTSFLLICSMTWVMAQSMSNKELNNGESNFTLGAFGGLNIPDLTGGGGNPLSANWSSRTGGAFGVTFNWYTSSHFAWRADLLYSSEGGKRDGMQALDASSINPQVPAGTYFYANYNNESVLNYLELPVMAKYILPLSKTSKFYIDFGPYVGLRLNAKQVTGGSSMVYADEAGTQPVSSQAVSFDASTSVTSQINTFNFGLTGGIGFSQSVGFGAITLDFRGAYGLTNVQRYAQDGSNHIGNLLISLGYSVPL
ncbi:porin family protein [Microbacter margulisiae]|uniref:Outer membrane protein beta-barrel domain-containing protein n=1 Tax=Microbacter margulisiae TaxID=1350067 RepID=A0A7W5DUI1_9PORP|nr:porin family protein [Microbacter margulisiae]MBB3188443.1 hypothetical protein [Microbacter margulisiae]